MKRVATVAAALALLLPVDLVRAQSETPPEPEAPEDGEPNVDDEPSEAEVGADAEGSNDAEAGDAETGDALPPSETDVPDPNAVTPPRLLEFVQAEGVEVNEPTSVTFVVVIDVDGSVSEATVEQGVSPELDAAAEAAVRRLRFEPARRGGEAIAVQIRFRYDFEPPEPAVEEAPPEPEGALEVRLLEGADTPLAGATVLVTDGEGRTIVEDQTTEAGVLRVDRLAPGTYRVLVFAEGREELEQLEEVRDGEETAVVYRPRTLDAGGPADDGYGATAVVDPPPREVTRRTIRREELTRVAGTRGDALRTIELLPGVARPPSGLGVLLIRGSSPNDSQTFLEGNPVPLLYHFGGLTGFYNSRMLERIDFYPGNFSVRYGRATGGVVDVGVRDPRTDGFHGMVDVNVIDASAMVEGPITDVFRFGVAARRSYIDAFFGLIPFGDDIDPVAAPVYWDYQVHGVWRPSEDDRIRFRSYGSSDRFELLFSEPVADGNPGLRGNVELVTWFHRLELDWRHRYSEDIEHTISVSTGPTHIEFEIGADADFNNDQIETQIRSEWRFQLKDQLSMRLGLDWFISRFDIQFTGLNPGVEEGDPTSGADGLQPGSAQDTVFVDTTVLFNQPAMYLELDYQPTDWLRIVPGVRVDHFALTNSWTVDPRAAAIGTFGNSRVKVGAGWFTQAPEPNESSEDIGNANLASIRAFHLSAGFEQTLARGVTLGAEGFYKYLYDRVVQTETGVDPVFSNDGTGRVYGLELSGRISPSNDFPLFGFASYTLSRSERNDRDDP
ncbi:MAG: TonB-dependent receptor, partial [Myxococcota bacterium]